LAAGTTRTALILDGSTLKTEQLGTMALEASSGYYYSTQVDTLITDVSTQLGGRLDNVDTSLGTLNGLINTNTADIGNVETSLGTLNGLINTNTSNISTNTTDIGNIETSLGTLNGLINTNTSNISTNTTDIGNIETSLGTLNGLINTNIADIGNVETSLGTLNGLINTNIADIGNVETSLGTLNGLINTNTSNISTNTTDIGNVETSLGTLNGLINTNTADIAALEGAVPKVTNGLQLIDGSVGLGGTLTFVGDTSITTSASNTLSFGGLVTSSSDNSYALVQNNPAGPIKTRQLGNMAWAATSTYRTSTDIDTSLAFYVKKAGDTMTGPLNITGGGLKVGTTGDQYDVSIFGGLYVKNGATIGGNLYVDGSLFVTNVHTIDVSAGFIRLNTGMAGTPPASMQSGIAVERGDLEPYVFIFDESTQDFRIGIAVETSTGFLDASTQAVATREDTPTDTGVAFWNTTLNRFDTDAGFFFDKNNGLQVDVSITGLGITLSDLQDQATEATSLMIDTDGVVGTRELGTNAFSSASYVLQSLFDTSITAIWTKFGNVDTSLGTLNGLINTNTADIGNVETSLGTLNGLINTNTADIGNVETSLGTLNGLINTNTADIGNLESSVGALDTLTQSHTQSITDLSTNKLDSVANATGTSGTGIFAVETGTTAYLKTLVGGTGATITSDSSTVTISVTSAEGYSEKWSGSFIADGSTSFVFDPSSISGTGPYGVTVWEANEVVQVGVANSGGTITLSWTPLSLSGTCDVLVIG